MWGTTTTKSFAVVLKNTVLKKWYKKYIIKCSVHIWKNNQKALIFGKNIKFSSLKICKTFISKKSQIC